MGSRTRRPPEQEHAPPAARAPERLHPWVVPRGPAGSNPARALAAALAAARAPVPRTVPTEPERQDGAADRAAAELAVRAQGPDHLLAQRASLEAPALPVELRTVRAPEVLLLGHARELLPRDGPRADARRPPPPAPAEAPAPPPTPVAAPPPAPAAVLGLPALEPGGPAQGTPEAAAPTVQAAPPPAQAGAAVQAAPPPPGPLAREAAPAAKAPAAAAPTQAPEPGAEVKAGPAAAGKEVPAAAAKEAMKEGAPVPAAAAGAGGAPSDTLAGWTQAVGGSVQALPKPKVEPPPRYVFSYKEATDGPAAARAAAQKKLAEDAKKAVEAAKEPENPPAIQDDPTGSASKRVDEKTGRKLPDQRLPDLVVSPGGHQPEVGKRVVFSVEKGREVEDTRVTLLQLQAKAGDPAAKKKLKELEAQAKKPLTPEDVKARAQGVTVKDEPPKPKPPVPPMAKVDTADILARLLEDPATYAQRSVDATRAAYHKGVLLQFPQVGRELVAPEIVFFEEELGRVRDAAGVKAEDLAKKVEERRKLASQQKDAARLALDAEYEKSKKVARDSTQAFVDGVAGVRASIDRQVDGRVAAVQGGVDLTEIRRKREAFVAALTQKTADWVVRYDDAGKARKAALDKAAYAQAQAYEAAAEEDKQDLAFGPYTDEGLLRAQLPIEQWLKERQEALSQAVGTLKRDVGTTVAAYQEELRAAATSAREEVRAWADKQTGRERSWLQALIDRFLDWALQARAESDAWAKQRAREATESLDQNMVLLAGVRMKFGEELDEEERKQLAGLGEEQRAVIEAYYRPGGKDAVQALAEGLATRISLQRRPELVKKLGAEVLASTDVALVRAVAEAEDFDVKINWRVQKLRNAFTTWKGTDEDAVMTALGGLTPIGGRAVELAYEAKFDEPLKARLKSELDDWATTTSHDLDQANALLAGDKEAAAAVEADRAMEGTFLGTGWGTDREKLFELLEGKSPEEIQAISAAYKKKYGRDLIQKMDAELDDGWSTQHDVQRMYAIVRGDMAAARAIELDQAMRGNVLTLGYGTDRGAIEKVYEKVKKEVEAEGRKKGWSSDRIKAEIARRHQGIDEAFEARYGYDYPDRAAGQSALTAAYHSELSSSELNLVVGLHTQDWKKVDAARIDIERKSFFYADDKVINTALNAQNQRDFQDYQRDELLLLEMRKQRDNDLMRRGLLSEKDYRARWNREAMQKAREDINAKGREHVKGRAAANFAALQGEFNTEYARGGLDLQAVVLMNTSGSDRDAAATYFAQGGYLSEEQLLDFAIAGVGTDEEGVKGILQGKSRREIEDLASRWEKLHPGKDFYKEVLGEFSGREAFDVQEQLYGVPQTKEDFVAAAKRKKAFEHDSSNWLSSEERDLVDAEVGELEAQAARLEQLERAGKTEWDEEWQDAFDKLERKAAHVDAAVALHREAVDTATDLVTTIVAVVVTIIVVVVAALLTPVSAGGSAAAGSALLASMWVALGASVAATLASMATKAYMKGAAYGWEEIALDSAVGVVEAIASAATAGMGGKLLRAGMLGRMAQRGVGSRMAAYGLAEAAEGVVQSIPGALTSTVLNDDTYKHGNPLLNILGGVAMGAGASALLSGGIGSLGGIAKPHVPAPRTHDLLALRGSPKDRLALWKEFKVKNPGKSMKEFLAELDAAILARQSDAFDSAAMQRAMRKELLEHLPPSERRRFADVAIEVLSEADFKALTRSDTGNAVTVFRRGKPTVIVKAGTDLSALGEEGLHLLQARSREWRRVVRALDETALSRWDALPVEQQFALYRSKLTLEIDAQLRLIRSLEAKGQLARDASRFAGQLERARGTLANLRKRLDEVDDVTSFEKVAMQKGALERPQYLDQPARLFSKEDPALKVDPGAVKAAQELPGTPAAKAEAGWPNVVKQDVTHGPMAEGPPVRTARALETVERVEVADPSASTFFDDPSVKRVFQVGPAWEEHGRLYRLVEAEDASGRILRQREEILQENGTRWQQRGSEATRAGGQAEVASKLQTARDLKLEPMAGTGTPPRVWSNKEGTVFRLETQSASGQGFDEVILHFDKGQGPALIHQIEVKRYGGAVGFADFTASTINMPRNMVRIAEFIDLLPPALRERAWMGLLTYNMLVEVRVAPGTKLGDMVGSASVLKKIERVATLWRDLVEVGNLAIGHPKLTATEARRLWKWGEELRKALEDSGNSFDQAAKKIESLEREVARVARKVDPGWSPRPLTVLPQATEIDAALLRQLELKANEAARVDARPAAHALRQTEAVKLTTGPYTHVADGPPHWGSAVFQDAKGTPVIVSTPVLPAKPKAADLGTVGATLLEQLRYRLAPGDAPRAAVVLDTHFLRDAADLKRVLIEVWKGARLEPGLMTRLTVTVDVNKLSRQQLDALLKTVGPKGGLAASITHSNGQLVVTFTR